VSCVLKQSKVIAVPILLSLCVCLQVAGFDADEVEHLLCALFEASDYRRDAIARVRASAW
jgi:ATP-dependent protease Clp ATPase subunit